MRKRSQSALEYLSTYAWAMIVIVVVGILLWVLFSPSYFPTRSTIAFTSSEKVGVLDYSLREDGTLDLLLVNRQDFEVTILKIKIGNESYDINKKIPAGGTLKLRISTNYTGKIGQTYQYNFEIKYVDVMEHNVITRLVGIFERAPLTEYFFAPSSENLDEYDYQNIVPTASVTLAKTPNWYGSYHYRYELNITDLNTNKAKNLLYAFTFNSAELIRAGKMKPDCSDIYVVWKNGTQLQEIPFKVFDCGSENARIEMIIPSFNTSEIVYIYYGLGE